MDEEVTDLNEAIAPEEQQEDFILATITEVGSAGVKLQIDGSGDAGEKEYKVNTSQKFTAGDRVKICKNSGTYLVEYRVGSPMETYPIPSGGTDGQVLTKNGVSQYSVKWADPDLHGIPTGGTTGQVLAKSSSTNYAVSWQTINGVPGTGTTGHVLTKTSTGFGWAAAPTELPSGGSNGQVLTKTASGVAWSAAPSQSSLVSGNYSVALSSGVLTPSTSTYAISLGSSTYRFNNLYTNGNAYLCGASSTLSFFGATGARRQTVANNATVATLITALKAYGLIN